MDDKLKRTIGNQLWECRVKKGWTQAFVSRQLGISIRTISRVENGSGISKTLLKKMCSLYRVSVNELYKQDETIIKTEFSSNRCYSRRCCSKDIMSEFICRRYSERIHFKI